MLILPLLILTILLAPLLFVIGLNLLRINSFLALLESYEQFPHEHNFFNNYFLRLKFPLHRRISHWSLDKFGDKFVTTFYRIAGVFFMLLALALPFGLYTLYTQPTGSPAANNPIEKVINITNPPPTPLPFQELTIPYLRSRSYASSLGPLNQAIETNSYTAYLTSYDSDGLTINGLLYIPTGSEPVEGWPAVVFVHGYIPPQEYETLENYNSYAGFLASQGLVVFKIDLRGHDKSEGEPGGAYYSGDYVIDTLNARAALQNFDQVNPDQIGLWGHSMAGNVVFRSLAAMPSIPKVVIWAGAVYTYEDFQDFRIQDNSYQPPSDQSDTRRKREELFNTHGDFDPTSPFWSQVPATNYLNEITGAVQIHHATDDNVVDIRYSQNLMSILDNTSIPHELFEYSSGGHNLTGTTFDTAMNRSASFLTDY